MEMEVVVGGKTYGFIAKFQNMAEPQEEFEHDLAAALKPGPSLPVLKKAE